MDSAIGYGKTKSKLSSGLPCWLRGKDSKRQAGDADLTPGLGRSLGEGDGNPLQYTCRGNPTDRGAWWATVHGVTRVRHYLATKQPQG